VNTPSCQAAGRSFARVARCRYSYRFDASWPNSAASHTITTVMATAKRYSPAVKVSPHMESGRTLQGPSKTETKNFHMAVLLTAKPPAKARPLRIYPQGSAVQK
jgi:hypothetical protein